jgi:hypothetical protein
VTEPGRDPDQAVKREATNLAITDALDVSSVEVEFGRCGTHRQATRCESHGDRSRHCGLRAPDILLVGSARRDGMARYAVTTS